MTSKISTPSKATLHNICTSMGSPHLVCANWSGFNFLTHPGLFVQLQLLNEVERNIVHGILMYFLCHLMILRYYYSQRLSPLPLSVMVDNKVPQYTGMRALHTAYLLLHSSSFSLSSFSIRLIILVLWYWSVLVHQHWLTISLLSTALCHLTMTWKSMSATPTSRLSWIVCCIVSSK